MPVRNFRAVIAALLLGPFAAACANDPFTGERETSKTAKGAAIGALAGAAVGALTGGDSRERRNRALLGAGIGGLTGGAVGYYMDRQEQRLREQLARTGVSVTRVGDDIHLNMPGDITFETNQSDVKGEFYDVLNSVALVLKEFDKTLIDIEGHTDSTGSDQYNMELSQRRASSVASYLAAQGIDTRRILTTGAGEARPLATNDSPEGRRLNRRVELRLTPIRA